MKILMFGQTGQVAREVLRQSGGHQITALGRKDADLADPAACARAVLGCDADLILNAAAYTAVDRAESEPDLAMQVNSAAPAAMARAAAQRGLPFLHISTDYVFDGSGSNARSESDAANPLNRYGKSKLAGEIEIVASGAQAIILRTSWVFSAHGSNFVKTMLRLGRDRDALAIVADQIGGPTPAADIAKTLIEIAGQAVESPQKRGIWHYSGSPDVSWNVFAVEIFAQSGRRPKITGIPTSAYPAPARRPLNSRLDCSRLMADFGIGRPDWKAGLSDVLRELGELR